jgi:hypothetical protein
MFRARMPLLVLACGTVQAHVVSISSGELRVTGPRTAAYELRMPAYEVEHVRDAAAALLDEVSFAGARRASSECRHDGGTYVCTAVYEFAEDIGEALEVECTLYRVTVPNHVHLLYAVKGEESDQQVFDQSYSRREMRFHPPAGWQRWRRDAGAGALRALRSVPGLLFLAVLALAARSRREAGALAIGFLAAEWAARPLAALAPIGFSPEFLEAAMALTVAYLAAEILFLPESQTRWAISPVLGLVHGLPYAAFPGAYLAGAAASQAALLAVLAVSLRAAAPPWRKRAAAVLLAAGLAWFGRLVWK